MQEACQEQLRDREEWRSKSGNRQTTSVLSLKLLIWQTIIQSRHDCLGMNTMCGISMVATPTGSLQLNKKELELISRMHRAAPAYQKVALAIAGLWLGGACVLRQAKQGRPIRILRSLFSRKRPNTYRRRHRLRDVRVSLMPLIASIVSEAFWRCVRITSLARSKSPIPTASMIDKCSLHHSRILRRL